MWREILGLDRRPSTIYELIQPKRSFDQVILPPATRQQLYEALTQIEKHRLIFGDWGLGECHPTGTGLVFNFAGPPGTGKTICAEAIAYTLGKRMLRVRYSELESCWAGETGKNIRGVFREARSTDSVLFFDEADSVATRRFSSVQVGYEREANMAVNILLKEVEEYEGVVIFATNLAANFDPAFERRVRTHILFQIPDAQQREEIWRLQVHPQKTPLETDVDFTSLAENFVFSGGDIRNAVLKAAQMAAAEQGADAAKRIAQRHFEAAALEVTRARMVMAQNAVDDQPSASELREVLQEFTSRLEVAEQDLETSRRELGLISSRQEEMERDLGEAAAGFAARWDEQSSALARLDESESQRVEALTRVTAGMEQLEQQLAVLDQRVRSGTLVPVAPALAWLLLLISLAASFAFGFLIHGLSG